MNSNPEIVVALTGASGTLYGFRLLMALLSRPMTVHLIVSDAGRKVAMHETDWAGEDLAAYLAKGGAPIHPEATLNCWEPEDLFAPPASGSHAHGGMVIIPCSMKTLGAVASGLSDTLIHRAADVCLKERRPLLLVTRETPLNLIHMENMLRVARAGATLLPASPSFYFKPSTIEELVDTVVARVLDHLHLSAPNTRRWGEETPCIKI